MLINGRMCVRLLTGVLCLILLLTLLGRVVLLLAPMLPEEWALMYGAEDVATTYRRAHLLAVERKLSVPLFLYTMPHRALSVSPDLRYASYSDERYQMRLFDLRRWLSFPIDRSPLIGAWSSTGQFLYKEEVAEDGIFSTVYRLDMRQSASSNSPQPTSLFQFDHAIVNDLAWSPYGQRIAYSLRYQTEQSANVRVEDSDIYVRHISGGIVTNLSHTTIAFDALPVWSPDGSQLAFFTAEYNNFISLVDADGENLRRRALAAGVVSHLIWSPDRRYLAFLTLNTLTFSSGIYLLAVEGESPAVELLPYASVEGGLAWSADSRELAYVSLQDGDVWAINVHTRQQRRLTQHPGEKSVVR
ncbi:MAG: hypothetical protein SF029_07815 [bacterium]|nr:hypothetical protein [bacterium]